MLARPMANRFSQFMAKGFGITDCRLLGLNVLPALAIPFAAARLFGTAAWRKLRIRTCRPNKFREGSRRGEAGSILTLDALTRPTVRRSRAGLVSAGIDAMASGAARVTSDGAVSLKA
jgi:hypothetical protein